MPGIAPTQAAFAHRLAIAFKLSNFVEEIAQAIRRDATVQLSDGTQRDPSYVVRDKDGKIKKFWRTEKDIHRIRRYQIYDKIQHEGTDFLKPNWYHARQGREQDAQTNYQAYNFLTVISDALVNLQMGNGVTIRTGIESLDVMLNDDMKITEHIKKWTYETSVYGFVGIQIVSDEEAGTLEIHRILPHNLYVRRAANKDAEPLCISKKIFIPKEEIPDWDKIPAQELSNKKQPLSNVNMSGFVFEERHFKGMIENYLWVVNDNEITNRIPMKYYMPEVEDIVLTGLQDFAITIIPNEERLGEYIGDWDNLLSINLSFNDRASRIGELLNKFEAPQMVVSETQATLDPSTGKVYYRVPRQGVIMVRPQDKFTPTYLQPSVDTAGSENNLQALMRMVGIHSQVSLSLFDPAEMTKIESGRAYKLKLTPTIAKVDGRTTPQIEAWKKLIFNIMSAINFSHEKNLVMDHLQDGIKVENQNFADKCKGSLNRLQEGGMKISLDSFEEIFSKFEVLNGQPRGIFIQDPALAETPEELQYLADEGLLNRIMDNERQMQEILRLKQIDVEFASGLPQDDAAALERVNSQVPTLSQLTYLEQNQNMTTERAQEEIRRINDQQQAVLGNVFDGLAGGMQVPGEDAGIPDLGNVPGDAITEGAGVTAVAA